MTTARLLDDDFTLIGSWTTTASRPHRSPLVRLQPGLYAFVIGDSVMYVGHAAFISRRLRTYSRRAFFERHRPAREISSKIASSVEQGLEVLVFAKVAAAATMAQLENMDARVAQALQPPWNRVWETSDEEPTNW